MQRAPIISIAALALGVHGCFTADLDDLEEGSLVCRVGDPDAGCPEGLACAGNVCVEAVPTVEITSPEGSNPAGQIFDDPEDLQVVIRGMNFSLSPDADNAGFVRVTLDGASTDIDMGQLSDAVLVDFEDTDLERPTEPGPHRLTVEAFRVNGTPFGNPEARATRLFWIDDGQPHVAILKPWPGTVFDLDTPLVDFEVAALNFDFDLADTDVDDPAAAVGHAHIHYNDEMPECTEDPACDPGYIAVVSPQPGEEFSPTVSAAATLPASGETTARLSAVLRRNDHSVFDADLVGEDDDMATVIFDEIEIVRAP